MIVQKVQKIFLYSTKYGIYVRKVGFGKILMTINLKNILLRNFDLITNNSKGFAAFQKKGF